MYINIDKWTSSAYCILYFNLSVFGDYFYLIGDKYVMLRYKDNFISGWRQSYHMHTIMTYFFCNANSHLVFYTYTYSLYLPKFLEYNYRIFITIHTYIIAFINKTNIFITHIFNYHLIILTTLTLWYNVIVLVRFCSLNLFLKASNKCHVIDRSNLLHLTMKLWSSERDRVACLDIVSIRPYRCLWVS